LNAASYNTLSHALSANATSQTFYRSVSGGTPATVGKLATCTNITAATCVDNGLVGDTTVAPTVNSTGSLLWATDGGGDIGAIASGRPRYIRAFEGVISPYVYGQTFVAVGGAGNTIFTSVSDGILRISGVSQNSFTRLQFGLTTNSAPALATSAINGFAIQSAAGSLTYNDAVSANSATVAARRIFDIDTPTLTSTGTSVTYTTATALHLGIPTASTNVTIGTAFSLIADGVIQAGGYKSSDGTAGVTVTACTGFKNGLCISGT